MHSPDDIWYAIANTTVLLSPQRRLETFGHTVINYHLISEKMDSANETRVREGRVHAEKPQVLTPAYFENLLLEGFGKEAEQYVDWLRIHIKDLAFLKYGIRFRKEESRESTFSEKPDVIGARVKSWVEERGEPLTAVIMGVDDAWEICLLKFVTDLIRKAMPEHVEDLRNRKLLGNVSGIPRAVLEEIEEDFRRVKDVSSMKALGAKLRSYGIFEQFEDRFYSLVRRVAR